MAKRTRAERPEVENPVQAEAQSIAVDLGLARLLEFENMGYTPAHAEVKLSQPARTAIKRLAVTLDQKEARLADGTLVKSSVPKSITWLCERLADAI